LKDTQHSLTWISHPAADDPFYKPLALVGLVLGVSIGASLAFAHASFGILAFLFLAVSLARYFLPTSYHLSQEGLTARFLGMERRRDWGEFRNFYPHAVGVHLSPFARPSRLDPFRGQFLRFRGNRDEVLKFIARYIER